MSRALSQQQMRILGLAASVSRLRHEVPLVGLPPTGVQLELSERITSDMWIALAAHVLGGVRLQLDRRGEFIVLENTSEALSARGSISRAITSLEKQGLLADQPGSRPPGYVLTEAGREIALEQELSVPDLERRIRLVLLKTIAGVKKYAPTLMPHGFLLSPEKIKHRAKNG